MNTPWKSFSLQGIEIESEYGKIFTSKKSFLLFFHIFWNIKKITIRLHCDKSVYSGVSFSKPELFWVDLIVSVEEVHYMRIDSLLVDLFYVW